MEEVAEGITGAPHTTTSGKGIPKLSAREGRTRASAPVSRAGRFLAAT